MLTLLGQGPKTCGVPLPVVCVPVLQTYRQLRGVPAQPGGSLKTFGLYDEVKAIFVAAANRLQKTGHAGAARLRLASPHWLRHAYARQMIADYQVPLPAVQVLLWHASVHTTGGLRENRPVAASRIRRRDLWAVGETSYRC